MKKSRKPFSVIAPSKKWIGKNLRLKHKDCLGKLPGRYTLVLEKRRRKFLKECSSTGKLGVRIPKNEFTRIVKRAGVPFVTTSVNLSGKKHIRKISQIPKSFLREINYVVDAGTLRSSPSKVLDLTGPKPKRLR